MVGGAAAIYTDSQQGIEKNLPAAAIWIISWTLILLFLFTGSVLLPIKAVLLNFISLGATLGFLTWVFIGGNLQWLIGDFINSGTIDTSSLVLIVIVAFGLSMDYELFLLSRIKEQHEAGLGFPGQDVETIPGQPDRAVAGRGIGGADRFGQRGAVGIGDLELKPSTAGGKPDDRGGKQKQLGVAHGRGSGAGEAPPSPSPLEQGLDAAAV